MIGPFSRRLMEWVHEEGHCSTEMLAWDWDGLRPAPGDRPRRAPPELEDVKAAITAMTSSHTKAELFAEAQRRRVLLAPVATAAELVADEHLHARGYWTTVDGRTCPGPFVKSSAWPLPVLPAPPAVGANGLAPREPAGGRPAGRRAGRAACRSHGLKVVDLTWVFAGPLSHTRCSPTSAPPS